MKRIYVAVIIMLFLSCGCLTQTQLDDWNSTMEQVVPAMEQVLVASAELEVSNEKIAKINMEAGEVLADVKAVQVAVAEAKTPEEAIRKGIDASRPFNPYADEMNVILGLITVLGGVFGGKKLATTTKKYSAIKKGVNIAS